MNDIKLVVSDSSGNELVSSQQGNASIPSGGVWYSEVGNVTARNVHIEKVRPPNWGWVAICEVVIIGYDRE